MNSQPRFLPLGDFKPADHWQTHVNEIFYGIQGPGIHNHFQTYVSLDHRLAHALAEDYYEQVRRRPQEDPSRFVMEWGVGNGNLAGCFLTHLQSIDTEGRVYPRTRYILCDFSMEILKGARDNPRLKNHAGKFFTVRVDANHMECFREGSADKIISNEIWDDLATKVLLKQSASLYEEYLQPLIDPEAVGMDFDRFLKLFNGKDLDSLKTCPHVLSLIQWERSYQRVDIEDWPHAEILEAHVEQLEDEVPVPVNLGALATLERARRLLGDDAPGYTGMDYGMHSLRDLNFSGRPYFNLYGGQYTFMVNFELLGDWAKAAGFSSIEKEYQHHFVGKHLNDRVISVVELVQTHARAADMQPWDRDILLLKTLHVLNEVYKNPYRHKMEYPAMEGTPEEPCRQIAELADSLSEYGVPDTVAYVSESEVRQVADRLAGLGYDERDYAPLFQGPAEPISFVIMNFR
ncbi:hypothetical protein UR09_00545 [Candidatus Nitromaritima sp. SCGC AAA799-A02]|nr:hypothetical protein UZ36_07560 [Candidatus Nitromaritima sp. SCGC AAA799-C22]KMP12634.1 hypothetical protein UR09_00545 [Candidatus Nitromaritima sp. SCGC AAA799-A02]